MPQTIIPLSDDQLLAVADDPEAVKLFTSEERRRLRRLKPTEAPPDLSGRLVDAGINTLPAVGGTLGGLLGGAIGMGAMSIPAAVSFATVGGGVGEAAKQGINALRGKPASETSLLHDVARSGVEQGAYEALGAGITKGAGALGKAVYRGYLKPSLAKNAISKADDVVQTALDEALPVTQAGLEKAKGVIGELRGEVDRVLSKSPGTVDLHQVAEHVRAFAKQRYFKPGRATADFDAAMAVADRLDQHPTIANPFAPLSPAPVSPAKANEIKRGIDESIGQANFGVERGATKTTEKVARRALREGIEAVAPEVGALNAREGRLLEAARAITRAVGREANKSPLIGMNTIASGGLGMGTLTATRDPVLAATVALTTRLALTPEVATRAAIVAHRIGKMSGSSPAAVARAAVQAATELMEQGANAEGPQ